MSSACACSACQRRAARYWSTVICRRAFMAVSMSILGIARNIPTFAVLKFYCALPPAAETATHALAPARLPWMDLHIRVAALTKRVWRRGLWIFFASDLFLRDGILRRCHRTISDAPTPVSRLARSPSCRDCAFLPARYRPLCRDRNHVNLD